MYRTSLLALLLIVGVACAEAAPPLESPAPVPNADTAETQEDTVPSTMAMHEGDDAHEEGSEPETPESVPTDDHDDADHGDETDHGDDADREPTATVDRTIDVVMTEFAFEPASFDVAAGETITFKLINKGLIEHEFRLTTEHAAAEHIASGHEGHDEDASASEHEHDGHISLVPAGATVEMTVTFESAGQFDTVACLIPGHYEAGMTAPLSYSDNS